MKNKLSPLLRETSMFQYNTTRTELSFFTYSTHSEISVSRFCPAKFCYFHVLFETLITLQFLGVQPFIHSRQPSFVVMKEVAEEAQRKKEATACCLLVQNLGKCHKKIGAVL